MTFPSHFPRFPAPCPYLPVTAGLWVRVQRALIGTNCPGTGITQCVAQFFSLLPMRANWPSNSLLPGHLCALCFGMGISPACGLIYHQLQCTPQRLPEPVLQKWQWALCKHWHCHLCSHILRYLSYPEFRHHEEADAVSDNAWVIQRTLVPGTCGVVTFQWRWLREEQPLFPERQRSYSCQLTPGMGICWQLGFVTVSFATPVTCSRYFMKWKISTRGFFALDIKKHKPKHRRKWERKRRNEDSTDKTREKC